MTAEPNIRHFNLGPDVYGRHLRRVVKHVRSLPLCEHRVACKCKRCRKAQVKT